MRRALVLAAGGLLLAAAPANAAWTPGVADLQTIAGMETIHDVAVDDGGNGLAVWEAPAGARSAIRVRRYDAAAGVWESPIRELSESTTSNRQPRVVMDDKGNAFALWQRYDGDRRIIQARRFDRLAGGWETASATLSLAEESSSQQTLAFEADGDAVAVWNADGVIRARRYDAAAGAWESSTAALSSDAGGAGDPAVTVDATGAATVAWETDGTIEAKRYDALKDRWPATPTRISPAGETAGDVKLGVDAVGRVQAVWAATDPTGSFVEGRRFEGGAWSPPVLHSPRVGTAYAPQLSVAPTGEATVVWFALSDGKYVVRARRWVPADERWDVAATLSSPATHAWSPQVAADADGRAIVVWRRPGSPSVVESRRFDGGWEPGPVALSGTTNAEAPDVAVGPRGDAIALWQRLSGSQVTLQARRFVAPVVAQSVPPAPEAAPPVVSGGGQEAPSVVKGGGETAAPPVESVPDAPEITRLRVRALERLGTALPRLIDSASGSRIELRLSAPARLRVTFERQGSRGWRPVAGSVALPAVQKGDVLIRFTGRLSKQRALAAGRYRLSVVATDADGRASAAARATFRLED